MKPNTKINDYLLSLGINDEKKSLIPKWVSALGYPLGNLRDPTDEFLLNLVKNEGVFNSVNEFILRLCPKKIRTFFHVDVKINPDENFEKIEKWCVATFLKDLIEIHKNSVIEHEVVLQFLPVVLLCLATNQSVNFPVLHHYILVIYNKEIKKRKALPKEHQIVRVFRPDDNVVLKCEGIEYTLGTSPNDDRSSERERDHRSKKKKKKIESPKLPYFYRKGYDKNSLRYIKQIQTPSDKQNVFHIALQVFNEPELVHKTPTHVLLFFTRMSIVMFGVGKPFFPHIFPHGKEFLQNDVKDFRRYLDLMDRENFYDPPYVEKKTRDSKGELDLEFLLSEDLIKGIQVFVNNCVWIEIIKLLKFILKNPTKRIRIRILEVLAKEAVFYSWLRMCHDLNGDLIFYLENVILEVFDEKD